MQKLYEIRIIVCCHKRAQKFRRLLSLRSQSRITASGRRAWCAALLFAFPGAGHRRFLFGRPKLLPSSLIVCALVPIAGRELNRICALLAGAHGMPVLGRPHEAPRESMPGGESQKIQRIQAPSLTDSNDSKSARTDTKAALSRSSPGQRPNLSPTEK